MPSKEELVTQLYQVDSPEAEGSGTSLRRNPRNLSGWSRLRLLPQAGLGCFGWLPPAYQTVTRWGSIVRLPRLWMPRIVKKGHVEAWKASRAGGGEGKPLVGREKTSWPSAPLLPSLEWSCDLTHSLWQVRGLQGHSSTQGQDPAVLFSPSVSRQSC